MCYLSPFEFTNIGFKNLNNFIASGFNNILSFDGKLHRIMTKLAFEMKGDAWGPYLWTKGVGISYRY